jgi:hypothetical protein
VDNQKLKIKTNIIMNTHILHLRSNDAIKSNNSYKFIIPSIVKKRDNKFKISLVSFSIPYSWGNITNKNNIIYYYESNLTGDNINYLSITITNGSYNIVDLIEHIENLLNTNTQQAIIYNIQYDEIYNKITISITNTNKKVIFNFTNNNICLLLGFYYNIYEVTHNIPLVSSYICNMYPDECIYLRTNITALNSYDSKVNTASDILQKININVNHNEYIYLTDVITPIYSDSSNISEIDILLTDEKSNIIISENIEFSLSILIEEIENSTEQIINILNDVKTLLIELLKLKIENKKSNL